jgi:hypothetical protein
MALDAQEQRTRLTVRGRLIVGIIIGIVFAFVVTLINGVWWDCDLTTDTVCKVTWGY